MRKMLFAMSAVGLLTVLTSSTASADHRVRVGGCQLPDYYRPRVVYRPGRFAVPPSAYYRVRRNYPYRDYRVRRNYPYRDYRNFYRGRYRPYRYGNGRPYYGGRGGIRIQGRRFGFSLGF